jgi:hypothetical protein
LALTTALQVEEADVILAEMVTDVACRAPLNKWITSFTVVFATVVKLANDENALVVPLQTACT